MLNYKLITATPHIRLAAVDVKTIEEIVGWKRPAFFSKPGRSAWLKLTQPVTVPFGKSHLKIQSVKIKGVGFFNQSGEQLKPYTTPFYRDNLHLGFKPDGTFIHLPSAPAPMGGMTLDRGIMEFFISSMLGSQGCYSQVPLSLYQYDEAEMTFNLGRKVPTSFCVTVTGLPTDNWLRVDAIDNWMSPDAMSGNRNINKQVFHVLDTWANSLNVPTHAHKPLATLTKIFHLYGQSLRKFHEIGYYRHNGAISNFIFSPEQKAIYFTDLDSSRPLIECSATAKPLQHMRDLASPMTRITCRLLSKQYINDATPERIFNNNMYNLFENLLLGYYHEAPTESVRAVVKNIRRDYEYRYSNARQIHAKRSQDIVKKSHYCQTELKKSGPFYWLNFDELPLFNTAVLWDLHEQSNLGGLYPHKISKGDMYKNIAELISPEFAKYIKGNT